MATKHLSGALGKIEKNHETRFLKEESMKRTLPMIIFATLFFAAIHGMEREKCPFETPQDKGKAKVDDKKESSSKAEDAIMKYFEEYLAVMHCLLLYLMKMES